MPKDNGVDEKVIARYVWTNAGMKGGEPQWVGNWVRYDDHAATVAELRGEVERLREANQLYSFAMNTAGIDELKRRADAAERRVGELEAAAFAARGRLNYLNSLTGEKIDADIIDKINAALTGADPT